MTTLAAPPGPPGPPGPPAEASPGPGPTPVLELREAVKEYPGRSHLMPSQEGWEQVADDALAWALDHARS